MMAHVAKYTAAAVNRMTNHYGRTQGDGVHRSNESINPDRTALNYNLAPDRPGGQIAYLHERLAEVKVQKRADVKVLCDWIVTLPRWTAKPGQDVDPNQIQRRFFEEAYRFLSDRYGEQNVISAYVHMDETTPHMHFAFIPVVRDKRHPEREKVSAKERINRSELKTFHGDLERFIQATIPEVSFEVMNDATREGNRTVTELKRETELRKQAEYAAVTEQARQQAQQAQEQVTDLQGTIGQLEQQQTEYAALTERARQQAQDAQERVEDLQGSIGQLEQQQTEYAALTEQARQKAQDAQERVADLQGTIGQLEQQQTEYTTLTAQAKQQAHDAQQRVEDLERHTIALRGNVKVLQQQKQMLSLDQIKRIDVKTIPLSKRVAIEPEDLTRLQDTAIAARTSAMSWKRKADEVSEQVDILKHRQSQMEQELIRLRPWAAIGHKIIDTVKSLGGAVIDLLQRNFPGVNWPELLAPPADLSRDRRPQQRSHTRSQDLGTR